MPADSEKYDTLAIPTYEEATSSRPSSSASYRGTDDTNENAERQGLLGRAGAHASRGGGHENATRRGQDDRGNYRPPTVESGRSSYESTFTSPEVSDEEDEADASLRRDLEEMEVSDPEAERRAQQRARMRMQFQKRIASVTSTFSNLHLPRLPGIGFFNNFRSRIPRLPIPERFSISWPIIARLVALIVIASVVYILVVIKIMPSRAMIASTQFNPDSVREFLLTHVESSKIESHIRELAFDAHLGGTEGDFFYANWIFDHFERDHVDAPYTEDFHVYVNSPQAGKDGRKVAILEPPEARWEASLDEDPIPESTVSAIINPGQAATLQRHQVGAFQAHAASGEATGPLVYANYGTRQDFEKLLEIGVAVKDSICLVRHWGPQPEVSLKIRAAEDHGCVGVLVYSDPKDDGPSQPDTPHSPNEGPWRSSDSVHRTSASLHNRILGDPLTPGWSSTQDADRISSDRNPALPNIPSLPLSWRDARALLASVQNVGAPVPQGFTGSVPNVAYWTGNATSSAAPKVQVQNYLEPRERQPIRNVIAHIRGLEEAEAPIYVGAPRDAFCFGATKAGSGTAIIMELVRIYGLLAQREWRPRRSIVFVSWDGAQYNAAGSTEHVEARQDNLRLHGISYISLDGGVYGNQLKARGSPIFWGLLHGVLSRVIDPSTNTSLLETWNASRTDLESLPNTLGDFLPFQDIAGVSSLDLSFTSSLDADRAPPSGDVASKSQQTPVSYPKGSCHDTLNWLSTHGDPGFVYHTLLTQLVAILVLELSDAPILPLDLRHYASDISTSISNLIDELHSATKNPPDDIDKQFNLGLLRDAGQILEQKVASFETWTAGYLASMGQSVTPSDDGDSSPNDGPGLGIGPPRGEPRQLTYERINKNQHVAMFESNLLDLPLVEGSMTGEDFTQGPNSNAERSEQSRRAAAGKDEEKYGLPWARQYKHVVHGPRKWDSGSNKPFPGIRDAFNDGDWNGVREQVEVVANRIRWAGHRLEN